MAKENNVKPKQNNEGPVAPSHCKFDGCKKSQDKFGFCQNHYEWYMNGVIRGDGGKPVDFEQKLSLHQWRTSQKKVA